MGWGVPADRYHEIGLVLFPASVVVFRFSRLAYLMYASLENLKAAWLTEKNPASCGGKV